MVSLVEYPAPRFDPMRRALQEFGFDQRLRANALQHLPISIRLAAGIIDRVGPEVLHA